MSSPVGTPVRGSSVSAALGTGPVTTTAPREVIVLSDDEDDEGLISANMEDNNDPMEKSDEHIIDEQGDLVLVLTAGPRIHEVYQVDSRALARSSQFWEQLISASPAHEGAGDGVAYPAGPASTPVSGPLSDAAVVHASEGSVMQVDAGNDAGADSPAWDASSLGTVAGARWTIHLDLEKEKSHVGSFSTLLYAAHGRLDRVPTHPTLSQFCSVLVLANRCNMVPIMRGHIHTWLVTTTASSEDNGGEDMGEPQELQRAAQPTDVTSSPGIPRGLYTQLRIYWEAGQQAEFQKWLGMLVWHTQADAGELSSVQRGTRVPWRMGREEVVVVADILDNIRRHRLAIITLALNLVLQRVKQLQTAGPSAGQDGLKSPPSCTVGGKVARDCDAFYYGLLIQELERKKVNPYNLPPPESVKKSPHALCALFEQVHDAIDARAKPYVSGRRTGGVTGLLAGHDCNPLASVVVEIKRARDSQPVELTEAQVRHFQAQSIKMGQKYTGR